MFPSAAGPAGREDGGSTPHPDRTAGPARSGAGQTTGFHRARVPIRARTFPAQTTRAMDMSHGPAESALPASIAGWLPAFIGLALAWGSSFFFAKVAVRELPPLYLTLGEDIAALSVLLGVLVVLGAWRGVGAGSLSGQLMCLAAAACDGFAFPYLWMFVTARHRAGLPVVAAMQLVATMQLVIVAPVAVRTLPAPTAWTPG